MTLGSLTGWGGFGKGPSVHPIERYHSGHGGYWEHGGYKSHGHSHSKSHGKGLGGGGGGGSGAALSALTLLAFLFLINVMQQSMQDNNSTMTAGTGTMAVLLRDSQQKRSPDAREETGQKLKTNRELETSISSGGTAKSKPKKGDTFGSSFDSPIYVVPVP